MTHIGDWVGEASQGKEEWERAKTQKPSAERILRKKRMINYGKCTWQVTYSEDAI